MSAQGLIETSYYVQSIVFSKNMNPAKKRMPSERGPQEEQNGRFISPCSKEL